jgi:hypothetical protein
MSDRLDRIEANLLTLSELQISWAKDAGSWQKDIRRAFDGLIESHAMAQKSMATLNDAIAKYIEAATKQTEASAAYVAESDARMKRLEENLDNLIRIITAEHANGKGKPPK